VEVTRTQTGCAPITKQVRVSINCQRFRLAAPRVIAVATDGSPTVTAIPDPALPVGHAVPFGQDITFEGPPGSTAPRAQPSGAGVGTTPAALDPLMRGLLGIFAGSDTSGMATRLVNAFLTPNRTVRFWSDAALDAAVRAHPNTASWVSLSLNAPTSPERSPGRTRIHQALQAANWDINAAVAPTDLGPPAFNTGNKVLRTGDWGNGLALMINGVRHVVVIARDYHYDACRQEYFIRLQYVFYDVFGLDDIDLQRFGASGFMDSDASRGITAWWQLQHQHGYVPLITRVSFEREFTVPAR
jgi:hypothetical protein